MIFVRCFIIFINFMLNYEQKRIERTKLSPGNWECGTRSMDTDGDSTRPGGFVNEWINVSYLRCCSAMQTIRCCIAKGVHGGMVKIYDIQSVWSKQKNVKEREEHQRHRMHRFVTAAVRKQQPCWILITLFNGPLVPLLSPLCSCRLVGWYGDAVRVHISNSD